MLLSYRFLLQNRRSLLSSEALAPDNAGSGDSDFTDLETHLRIGVSFEAWSCLQVLITLLNNFENAQRLIPLISFFSETELSSNVSHSSSETSDKLNWKRLRYMDHLQPMYIR